MREAAIISDNRTLEGEIREEKGAEARYNICREIRGMIFQLFRIEELSVTNHDAAKKGDFVESILREKGEISLKEFLNTTDSSEFYQPFLNLLSKLELFGIIPDQEELRSSQSKNLFESQKIVDIIKGLYEREIIEEVLLARQRKRGGLVQISNVPVSESLDSTTPNKFTSEVVALYFQMSPSQRKIFLNQLWDWSDIGTMVELANKTGVVPSVISRFFQGKSTPRRPSVLKIFSYFLERIPEETFPDLIELLKLNRGIKD